MATVKDPVALKLVARFKARATRLSQRRSRPELKHAYREVADALSALIPGRRRVRG